MTVADGAQIVLANKSKKRLLNSVPHLLTI